VRGNLISEGWFRLNLRITRPDSPITIHQRDSLPTSHE
jgi:hypothetical protein